MYEGVQGLLGKNVRGVKRCIVRHVRIAGEGGRAEDPEPAAAPLNTGTRSTNTSASTHSPASPSTAAQQQLKGLRQSVRAAAQANRKGGGMNGPVKADMGLSDDGIQVEWTLGGWDLLAIRQWGATSASAVALRFTGAVQQDDTGATQAVEVVMRGRHEEIDFGSAEPGGGSAS